MSRSCLLSGSKAWSLLNWISLVSSLNCVGEGGVFSVQAGTTQIGFYSTTVFEMDAEHTQGKLLPGMQPPAMIVAETTTDVPNVPVSVRGVTTTPNSTGLSDISSFQAMYNGWTQGAPEVPADYWQVPTACFKVGSPGGWVEGTDKPTSAVQASMRAG